jgi:hypothetical protein
VSFFVFFLFLRGGRREGKKKGGKRKKARHHSLVLAEGTDVRARAAHVVRDKHDILLHLCHVCESGHIDVVCALLDAVAETGKDGNGRGGYWGDPLINAAAAGHIDVVRALLDAGADVNTCDEYDETALIKAAEAGHIDVVRALVDAGAELNNKTCTYSFGR